MGKRVPIIALSLANLCFLSAWREVLSPQAFSYFYYWKQYPGYALGGALALNVLALASIFAAGHYLVQRFEKPWLTAISEALFVAIFIRALNELRTQSESLSTGHIRMRIGSAGYFILFAVFFTSLLLLLWRFGLGRVARLAAVIVVVLSPLCVVCGLQAIGLAFTYGPATSHERSGPAIRSAQSTKARVLWVIFDEMDERVSFDDRPAELELPQFDRLRSEGLFAVNAFPPAGHTTQSVPALLMGQMISGVEPVGPAVQKLMIPALHSTVNWDGQPDIFSDALAAGFNTALVGWCIPYCRIIGDHLDSCYWDPAAQTADPDKLSLMRDLVRQDVSALSLIPFVSTPVSRILQATKTSERSRHLDDYESLLAQAEKVVSNPDFGLIFIHLPVPHPPYIDRSYLDNLELADTTFGKLRRVMEEAHMWDNTTVIVSSDHWWRWDLWESRGLRDPTDAALRSAVPDRRVPFLVKLAGQSKSLNYPYPFNTVLTRGLALELLVGHITNVDQAATWLDAHRTFGESPYHGYDQ